MSIIEFLYLIHKLIIATVFRGLQSQIYKSYTIVHGTGDKNSRLIHYNSSVTKNAEKSLTSLTIYTLLQKVRKQGAYSSYSYSEMV